ncbi:hypothetical protein [Georgenia sp. AZ-5]|uniref:hypothetical protein n=1 Tax=Georgenia sp. AZ-5 TaxID=3367526 RepID=UPI0037541343
MVFKALFQSALSDWTAWVRDRLDHGAASDTSAPYVVQHMHQVLRAYSRAEAAAARELDPDERFELIAEWAASGGLTWTEAESLLELEEATAWRLPAR